MMPAQKSNLLIVDDDIQIRELLSAIFSQSGYRVRLAEDGFSALVEIRNEVPDLILSDLYMPGMSGFEFLSVVRRRFPAIHVIAMSGAFSGDGIPPGVAADAFYEKGTSLPSLLQIVSVMTQPKLQAALQRSATSAPIWVPTNGHDPSGEAYVMIACPECLRTFPQVLGGADCVIHEAGCHFCHGLIHYAIVKRADPASPRTLQQTPGAGMPTNLSVAS